MRTDAFLTKRHIKEYYVSCIILHNIIVEDEIDSYASLLDFNYDEVSMNAPIIKILPGTINNFLALPKINAQIQDKSIHCIFKANLVEHI